MPSVPSEAEQRARRVVEFVSLGMDRSRCVRDHRHEGVVLLRTNEPGVMFANFRVECRVKHPSSDTPKQRGSFDHLV
jgi:hypothetical protein